MNRETKEALKAAREYVVDELVYYCYQDDSLGVVTGVERHGCWVEWLKGPGATTNYVKFYNWYYLRPTEMHIMDVR